MVKHIGPSQLQRLGATAIVLARPKTRPDARCFSVLNRPPPSYEGHIPLTVTERLGLALGSGLGSFLDPRRGGEYKLWKHAVIDTDEPRSHRVLW
jgi:ubiquinone biosynthesis protein COQ4